VAGAVGQLSGLAVRAGLRDVLDNIAIADLANDKHRRA